MQILVAGSSGLVGSALVEALREQGHQVKCLIRKPQKTTKDIIFWNPDPSTLNTEDYENFDAVINLAGENIASGRWNEEKKREIRDSRVKGTQALCECLAQLKKPPAVEINASAMGYYGSQGDHVLTEDSPSGSGFLAGVCREWEAATKAAVDRGIRVAYLRTGMVLSSKGGALSKMLPPFKMGLGGVIGSGEQYVSWIALRDLVNVIIYILKNETLHGPINAGTPNPVTNKEFTKTLGRVLNRPTIVPMPAFAARIVLGEMADELLLSSTRMIPQKLLQSGYAFQYPHLEDALRAIITKQI